MAKYLKVSEHEVEAEYFDGTEASARKCEKLGSTVTFDVDDSVEGKFNVGSLRYPSGGIGGGITNLSPNTWLVKEGNTFRSVKDEEFKRDYVEA